MRTRLVRFLLIVGVFTAVMTLLEGGLDVYLALYCAAWAGFGTYAMLTISDDLARERFHPPEPGADRIALRAIRGIALVHLVVGALDAGRWHLTPIAPPLRLIGLAGMAAGAVLIVESMRANRFFSAVIRVQSERGHSVVDSGPYGTIRHPGYLGMLIAVQCSSLALGSWLGFTLAAVYGALIIRRVWFEDAFLKANLAGYQAYANRVGSRLIPGAW